MFPVAHSAEAEAQLASQTALVGTVTDGGGGVVPGAQVVAVNAGTKDTYETTTNAEGYYQIQFVRTGTYDMTVTLSGFQTFRVTGVEVANNQVVRTNAVMQVGALAESLIVTASAPMLATDSATVSQTISEQAIAELPLSGRNVWSLATATPGVIVGRASDIGLSFRGAGQREIQNSLSLDGINTASNLLAMTSMRPIAEAVEEMQIQTGSTSADTALISASISTSSPRAAPTLPMAPSLNFSRTMRWISADTSRTPRVQRIRVSATSLAFKWADRWSCPGCTTVTIEHSSWQRMKAYGRLLAICGRGLASRADCRSD